MSRRSLVNLLLILAGIPALACAAIWPAQIGTFRRASAQAVTPAADRALWDEYGFRDGETAQYEGDSQKFTATAWRFQDPTGALGAFEWMRPADSKPSALAKLACETPASTFLTHGNYLLRFDGYHPGAPFLTTFIEGLANVDNSALPALVGYLPVAGSGAQFRAIHRRPRGFAEVRPRDLPFDRRLPSLRRGPGGVVSAPVRRG